MLYETFPTSNNHELRRVTLPLKRFPIFELDERSLESGEITAQIVETRKIEGSTRGRGKENGKWFANKFFCPQKEFEEHWYQRNGHSSPWIICCNYWESRQRPNDKDDWQQDHLQNFRRQPQRLRRCLGHGANHEHLLNHHPSLDYFEGIGRQVEG